MMAAAAVKSIGEAMVDALDFSGVTRLPTASASLVGVVPDGSDGPEREDAQLG